MLLVLVGHGGSLASQSPIYFRFSSQEVLLNTGAAARCLFKRKREQKIGAVLISPFFFCFLTFFYIKVQSRGTYDGVARSPKSLLGGLCQS